MKTLGDIFAGALVGGDTERRRMQPHMFGGSPLPPELPPEQWNDTLRALLPDPATQWMQKRPPIVTPLPLPPDRQQHLSTMQRRFGY